MESVVDDKVREEERWEQDFRSQTSAPLTSLAVTLPSINFRFYCRSRCCHDSHGSPWVISSHPSTNHHYPAQLPCSLCSARSPTSRCSFAAAATISCWFRSSYGKHGIFRSFFEASANG
ncbi:hypothetical protein Q3G72_000936 [Acer saccharum]|nr:hypothetical protein Q3G72_000936 [Acer saccharum]